MRKPMSCTCNKSCRRPELWFVSRSNKIQSHKSKGNIISKMLMSMTLTSRSLSWVEMVQRNKRNSVRGLVLKVTEVGRDGTA